MYSSTAELAVVPVENPTHPGNALEGAAAALPMLAAVMQTGPAADEVTDSLGLARVYKTGSVGETRAAFWKHVSVISDRRSGIVKVTTSDSDSKRARDIAVALTDFAMRRMLQLWSAGPRAYRESLEARLADISRALADAEQELQRFRERNGIVDLDEQRRASVNQAAAQLLLGGQAAGARARHILPSLASLPRLEIEHARLKRAVDENVAVRDLLFRQIQQLRSEEAKPLARIDVIDAPIESHVPSRPSRLALMVAGAFVGAGFGLLIQRARNWFRALQLAPAGQRA
jgi:tyrosine-protein kinase Etk/Wzc